MWTIIFFVYALLSTTIATWYIFNLRRDLKHYSNVSTKDSLQTVFSDLQSSAVITDQDGIILYMNDCFLSNSGYNYADLIDQNISKLKSGIVNDFVARDLWQTLQMGLVWRGPFSNLNKEGQSYIEDFIFFPVKNSDDSTIFCAVSYNVQNRYMEEKQIESLQRKSISFKENFISNLSHEVRTPLNALVGLSQLGSDCRDIEKSQNYFAKINHSSKQLMQLLDDILDFSKIESGSFNLVNSRFNFMSLLTTLTSQYGPEAALKRLDFNFYIDDQCPQYLYADSFRIEQIISNLLSNAIKFTDTGEVSLSIAVRNENETRCTLEFKVSDTGIGIEETHLKGIFNPFSKLVENNQKRSNKSSGLGMAITKQIVDMMNGEILINSVPNEGTDIHVFLPFNAADIELNKGNSKSIGEALTILVIDDSANSRNNAINMLKSFGYTVYSASSGDEALQLLSSNNDIDLALVDWDMPEMSGEDMLNKLMSNLAYPPRILYITPFGPDSVDSSLKRLIHGFLPKPYSGPMLFDAISSMFATSPVSRKVSSKQDGFFTGLCCLLLDDNPVNNMIAKSMFEQEGASVTVFQSAVKALEHLKSTSYHFIVSDIDMPEMDGFEFLKAVRYANIKTPVYALTANTGDDNRQDIQNAGFNFYVSKPLTHQKMKLISEQLANECDTEATLNSTVYCNNALSLAAHSLKTELTEVELQQVLASLISLQDDIKLRKPKGGKERLQSLKIHFTENVYFISILDKLLGHLSRYQFDAMLTLLNSIIVSLGGDRENESERNLENTNR